MKRTKEKSGMDKIEDYKKKKNTSWKVELLLSTCKTVNNRCIGTMDQWQVWPERVKIWSISLTRCDVRIAVNLNSTVLWDVTSSSLVDWHQRFFFYPQTNGGGSFQSKDKHLA